MTKLPLPRAISLTSPSTTMDSAMKDLVPAWTTLPVALSSKHFSHAGFIGHVKDALETSAIDPQCLTIVLPESLAMHDVEATCETMSQLQTIGAKLSIDDFGAGYSSLSYLRRFPVD